MRDREIDRESERESAHAVDQVQHLSVSPVSVIILR